MSEQPLLMHEPRMTSCLTCRRLRKTVSNLYNLVHYVMSALPSLKIPCATHRCPGSLNNRNHCMECVRLDIEYLAIEIHRPPWYYVIYTLDAFPPSNMPNSSSYIIMRYWNSCV